MVEPQGLGLAAASVLAQEDADAFLLEHRGAHHAVAERATGAALERGAQAGEERQGEETGSHGCARAGEDHGKGVQDNRAGGKARGAPAGRARSICDPVRLIFFAAQLTS